MRVLSFIVIMLALTGCYNDPTMLRDLVARQKTTIGQVRYRDCANHGAVYYKFQINGQMQAGLAPSGILDCNAVKVGDPVKVYYDPVSPAVHTLMEPSRLYQQERGYYIPVWLTVTLLFVLLLVFHAVSANPGIMWNRWRKRSDVQPVGVKDEIARLRKHDA